MPREENQFGEQELKEEYKETDQEVLPREDASSVVKRVTIDMNAQQMFIVTHVKWIIKQIPFVGRKSQQEGQGHNQKTKEKLKRRNAVRKRIK